MRRLGFGAPLCVALCFVVCPAGAKTVVDSVGMTVSDMNRSVDSYTHVLNFREVADREVAGDDYEHDPDGHNLEILSFPPDKGAARWHRKDALFPGIDHSAIVVSDTEASLRFYRDQLGLQVAGVSDNFGTEQEHLNNVFGARLHITTLRPTEGPGVEFLQYFAPTDGRPMPADTLPDDLWYWQINLRSGEPQEHTLHDGLLGWSSARLVHDPDGHTTLIEHP